MKKLLLIALCFLAFTPNHLNAQACLPVAVYNFDLDANDYSGNDYHATLMAGASIDGGQLEIGYNNVDHAILPDEVLDGIFDFTISFDFYIDTFNTTGSSPTNTFIAGASASLESEFAISYEKNQEAFVVALNGSGDIFETDLVEEETWYCVIVKRQEEIVSVYLDGILIDEIAMTTDELDISFLEIGQELDCPGGCFVTNQCLNGSIDNLSVYDCITEQEDCAVFSTPCDTSALYRFTGNANDASGNSFDGNLNGGADVSFDYLNIGYNDDDYVDLPIGAINGLNDFAVSFNFSLQDFNTSGSFPTNTFIAGINASNEGEFAISYEHASLGFEIAIHDVGGVIPAAIMTDEWYCLTVFRKGSEVWAELNGDSLPALLELPLGEISVDFLEIGQELDCIAGCFVENQCMNGAMDELIITDCFDDVVCSQLPLGIDIFNDIGGITVYPNPAGDWVMIDLITLPFIDQILIRDIQGKVVFETNQITSTKITFNTTNLLSGIYFIQMSNTSDGYFVNSKFIRE